TAARRVVRPAAKPTETPDPARPTMQHCRRRSATTRRRSPTARRPTPTATWSPQPRPTSACRRRSRPPSPQRSDMSEPTEPVDLRDGEWLERNRARWDEIVPVHVAAPMYDRTALREGRGRFMTPMEESELAGYAPGGWAGKRVLHLQCHFGLDTLVFAQRGAEVVGIDFSMPAVEEARRTAAELGLGDRSRFVHANLYDARHALPDPGGFDLVYATWGTIGWLPDIAEWARIIAWFLKPGGRLYFADGHPAALAHDDPASGE